MEQVNNIDYQKQLDAEKDRLESQNKNKLETEDVKNRKLILPDEKKFSGDVNVNNIINFQTPDLYELAKKNEGKTKSEVLSDNDKDARMVAIYNEGIRYGAQAALYRVIEDFKLLVSKNENEINSTFMFEPLMLMNGKVQPPVILESKNNFYKEGKLKTRTIKQSYKIDKQVEVRNSPKTFHEYLNINAVKPKVPNPIVYPRNYKEKMEWAEGVKKGWERGIRQGNEIIVQKIRNLTSDYVGMVRFHLMKNAGIVSDPIAHTLDRGVNTNGEDINIGEVEFKITTLPEFNSDIETWKALPKVNSNFEFDK